MRDSYRLDSVGLRLSRAGTENSRTVNFKGSLPSLTTVGNNWLSSCSMLSNVNFKASVTELGLPSLTTIGDNFLGGSPANSFNFDELPSIKTVGISVNRKVETEKQRLEALASLENLRITSDGKRRKSRSKRKSRKVKSRSKRKRIKSRSKRSKRRNK